MPSKKKNKSTIKSKYFVFGLVALLLISVIVVAFGDFRDTQEENKRIQAMSSLGASLDTLNVATSDSVIEFETSRLSYCYNASRKSGPEPIYCYQGIEGVVQDIPNSVITVVQQQVRSVLLANDVIGFELTNSTDNDGIVHERFESEDCDATTYTRPAGVHDNFPESEFRLEVTCFGGEFSEFIYPEKVE